MKVNAFSRAGVTALLVTFLCQSYAQENGSDLFELSKIQEGKKSLRISSYDRSGGNNDRFEHIKDGEIREIFNVKGAGYINHIWITIAPPPEKLNRNDIIIRMYWDSNVFPAVESPIGPFFGQGWNESYDFTSLPLAVGPTTGRALVSYFIMPFSDGAKIEIENQTGQEIRAFYYYVDYVKVKDLPENMGRFQAWYNHELTQAYAQGENEWSTLGEQANNLKGENNYLISDIKGKGHFVGVNYYVHSPTPMWYGEGDDMIFIDGTEMPTLHGTGTEDYFNTSWCPKSIFSHPYFGYPRVNNDIGWLGRTHVYRFHINDPIYFDKSLKFTIEHGHNNCLTLDLASVAYWYQRPPLTKLSPIAGKEERNPKSFIKVQDIHKWRHEWRKNKGNDAQLWGNEK
jgi:hypothetical protein